MVELLSPRCRDLMLLQTVFVLDNRNSEQPWPEACLEEYPIQCFFGTQENNPLQSCSPRHCFTDDNSSLMLELPTNAWGMDFWLGCANF